MAFDSNYKVASVVISSFCAGASLRPFPMLMLTQFAGKKPKQKKKQKTNWFPQQVIRVRRPTLWIGWFPVKVSFSSNFTNHSFIQVLLLLMRNKKQIRQDKICKERKAQMKSVDLCVKSSSSLFASPCFIFRNKLFACRFFPLLSLALVAVIRLTEALLYFCAKNENV